jgi:hypothetical protein
MLLQATIDLHFMDKETAFKVVAYCIEALLENKQQGPLQVITGTLSCSCAFFCS